MKLVIRLLGTQGELLGWAEHQAATPGDGTLRASSDVFVIVDEPGIAAFVSTHWCQVNVETRVQLGASVRVTAGENLMLFHAKQEMVQIGPAAGGLPPVTMKTNQTIVVPTGGIGAVGNA